MSLMSLTMQLEPLEATKPWAHATDEQTPAPTAAATRLAPAPPLRADDAREEEAMALLAESHTAVEQQLYAAMLTEAVLTGTPTCVFSLERLMARTQLRNLSAIRCGLAGLIAKLSIEPVAPATNASAPPQQGVPYRIYLPTAVLARRAGLCNS